MCECAYTQVCMHLPLHAQTYADNYQEGNHNQSQQCDREPKDSMPHAPIGSLYISIPRGEFLQVLPGADILMNLVN